MGADLTKYGYFTEEQAVAAATALNADFSDFLVATPHSCIGNSHWFVALTVDGECISTLNHPQGICAFRDMLRYVASGHSYIDQRENRVHDGAIYGIESNGDLYELESPARMSDYA